MSKGTILVTGANGGLGSALVQQILSGPLAKDYYGIYTVRKVDTATTVKKILQKAASAQHKHELLPLDLTSLASARELADKINKRVASGEIPRIRALILNAGWQEQTSHSFTDDGFDMTFQSNYLSHYLLTLLLLQSLDQENGRIVVLGSWSHNTQDKRNSFGPYGKAYQPAEYQQIFQSPMDTEKLAKGRWSTAEAHPGDPCAGYRRYGAGKLCEIMMMQELSYRLPKDPQLSKVAVLGVDPGGMMTSLLRRASPIMAHTSKIAKPFNQVLYWSKANGMFRAPSKSAVDVLRAAFDTEELGDYPNGLYMDGSSKSEVGAEVKDREKTAQLWRDSLGYAGVQKGDTILAELN